MKLFVTFLRYIILTSTSPAVFVSTFSKGIGRQHRTSWPLFNPFSNCYSHRIHRTPSTRPSRRSGATTSPPRSAPHACGPQSTRRGGRRSTGEHSSAIDDSLLAFSLFFYWTVFSASNTAREWTAKRTIERLNAPTIFTCTHSTAFRFFSFFLSRSSYLSFYWSFFDRKITSLLLILFYFFWLF